MTIFRSLIRNGAIALFCSVAGSFALGSAAIAQSTSLTESPTAASLTIESSTPESPTEIAQANNPQDSSSPRRRPEDPRPFEETEEETIEDNLDSEAGEGGSDVEFFLRLNTELFVNGGDLVEFEVPIRYAASERLFMQASPIIKYFPESSEENFDYGFKFAVEYQL